MPQNLLNLMAHELAREIEAGEISAREAAEAARAERDAALVAVRTDVDRAARELAELTDVAHRDEVARAQQALRIEQLQTRAVEELGLDPAVLLEEFGPHQPIPVLGDDAAAPAGRSRRGAADDDGEATGGTAEASLDLVRRAGGEVVGLAVLLELGFLGGRARLTPALSGAPLDALVAV